jgi:hypothetical protein
MMQSGHLSRLCLAVITSVAALASRVQWRWRWFDEPIQGVSPGGIWRGTDSASGLAIMGLVDETGFGEFIRADNAQFAG